MEWISIFDITPDRYLDVLFLQQSSDDVFRPAIGWLDDDDTWHTSGGIVIENVFYWAPLPELPKEG